MTAYGPALGRREDVRAELGSRDCVRSMCPNVQLSSVTCSQDSQLSWRPPWEYPSAAASRTDVPAGSSDVVSFRYRLTRIERGYRSASSASCRYQGVTDGWCGVHKPVDLGAHLRRPLSARTSRYDDVARAVQPGRSRADLPSARRSRSQVRRFRT